MKKNNALLLIPLLVLILFDGLVFVSLLGNPAASYRTIALIASAFAGLCGISMAISILRNYGKRRWSRYWQSISIFCILIEWSLVAPLFFVSAVAEKWTVWFSLIALLSSCRGVLIQPWYRADELYGVGRGGGGLAVRLLIGNWQLFRDERYSST